MQIPKQIKVNYQSIFTAKEAKEILENLGPTIACDFEVSVRYTPEELKKMQEILDDETTSRKVKIATNQALRATALDHPYHCKITHFSCADKEDFGYVFVLDNPEIEDYILNFLVNTDKTQIWHNASYDFKHIYFNTKKFPKNYEDTQILAKTLINNVDTFKSRTGLKLLAGNAYGDWAISADNFTLDQMHEEKVLHYATIDACATMWLWNKLQNRF